MNFPPYHPSSPLILFSILLLLLLRSSIAAATTTVADLPLSRSAAVATVATSRRRRPSLSLSFAPEKEAAASPALSPLCSSPPPLSSLSLRLRWMKTDNTRRSSSPTRWGDDGLRLFGFSVRGRRIVLP
ncbi:hypothetical protein LINGRAHAP2_LOCUS8363 [Linum grandiflorum]